MKPRVDKALAKQSIISKLSVGIQKVMQDAFAGAKASLHVLIINPHREHPHLFRRTFQ
jgi:hypothetical protein